MHLGTPRRSRSPSVADGIAKRSYDRHRPYGGLVIEAARRRKSQPAPPHVIFEALTHPDRDLLRPWMHLQPGEVRPHVVHAQEPHLLVWSSLWGEHPEAQVRIELERRVQDSGTDLTWTLLLPGVTEHGVGAERVRAFRYRLNKLINGDLRETFDQ